MLLSSVVCQWNGKFRNCFGKFQNSFAPCVCIMENEFACMVISIFLYFCVI